MDKIIKEKMYGRVLLNIVNHFPIPAEAFCN